MNSHIEIVEPKFALMRSTNLMPTKVWHIYCSGGWAKLACGGMNMDAAEKAFSSRPKTSIFSSMPIPSGPEVLLFGFDTKNFSGFHINEETNNGALVYIRASSVSPAWPYFSNPSDHFLAQLRMYNDLHSK